LSERIALLNRCKGDRSQVRWARELGATQGTISLWLSGDTLPSREMVGRLIELHPEYRDELIRVLLSDQPLTPQPAA
jgi:predicted transcriptional regulator